MDIKFAKKYSLNSGHFVLVHMYSRIAYCHKAKNRNLFKCGLNNNLSSVGTNYRLIKLKVFVCGDTKTLFFWVSRSSLLFDYVEQPRLYHTYITQKHRVNLVIFLFWNTRYLNRYVIWYFCGWGRFPTASMVLSLCIEIYVPAL